MAASGSEGSAPVGVRDSGFELWASRIAAALPGVLRRIPFTVSVVVLTLLVGLVSRAVWAPIATFAWYPQVAYGFPALQEGRVWTLVAGPLFVDSPKQYLAASVVFLVLVGACELRLGTRRVAISAIVGEVGGILVASLLLWVLSATPWVWAQEVVQTRDVGSPPEC